MVSQLQPASELEVIYPESDGRPIADNAEQFRRLGIRFKPTETELQIDRSDGKPFLTYIEIARQAEQAEQRVEQAEQQAQQAQQRADRLAAQLRAMGIDPEQI
jgi:hypothetical protein